jgi:cytochrome c oxidase subunit 2
MGVTDTATPHANIMMWLHQEVFFYLVIISIFVIILIAELLIDFWIRINLPSTFKDINFRQDVLSGVTHTHSSLLEVIWTLFPSLVLFMIALPSLDLLYTFDQILGWSLCLKVSGHQWYWTYEITGLIQLAGDLVSHSSAL